MTTFTAEPRRVGLGVFIVLLALAVIGLAAGWSYDHISLSNRMSRLETEIKNWLSTDIAKERFAAEKLQTEVTSLKEQIEALNSRRQTPAVQ